MVIPRRFRGPPESANGGYACGAVAALIDGPAEVTLRSPPPLDQPLAVERDPAGPVRIRDGETLVAEGRPAALLLEAPAPVSFDEASRAVVRYPWASGHPLPGCFVCGTERDDGLRIFPGAVEGREVAAAPWIPDASLCDASGAVAPEVLWGALDCPSWFGMYCFHAWNGAALLGRLAARIEVRPRAGDRCVCVGWFLGREGRKVHAGSAVYSESGALLALGRATWIGLR